MSQPQAGPPLDEYLEASIQRLLAEHTDTAEQGIQITRRGNSLVLRGEVESARRRDDIERLIKEHFPAVTVQCDIGLTRSNAPADAEELT